MDRRMRIAKHLNSRLMRSYQMHAWENLAAGYKAVQVDEIDAQHFPGRAISLVKGACFY